MSRNFTLFALLASGPLRAGGAVNFSTQIRPILSENCFYCHGPDDKKREAGLRLDDEVSAKATKDGVAAVVPGSPERSALFDRITSTDPEEVMPPPKQHKTLSAGQVALLREWIKQGAPWGKHWSYEKVTRPAVPTMATGGLGAVDAFLTQRQLAEGIKPSPAADRATMVRRVALDVTGLPPTLDELARFQGGEFSAVVDYYLNLPTYGEHWARQWLDLARYADSSGYPSDEAREIWPYRDWVVRALNANMPFDQFTIEQIAGDLLPNPTVDQITATAFHRNTMTQNEGGTSDEEFRNAAVIDRVNTTMAVWMGTTMACAQCHTHKFDPITIGEYFQFYAFFNQSADADKKDESPLQELWKPGQKEGLAKLNAEIAAVEAKFSIPDPKWLVGLDAWAALPHPELEKKKPKPADVIASLAAPSVKRTPAQQTRLASYYAKEVAPETAKERAKLAALKEEVLAKKPTTVPIMKELDEKARRVTKIQLRGNWQALGDEVQAGTPTVFPGLPGEAPRSRLTLAKWLAGRDNPLTARVTVNRLWETVFGVGIVRSSEEFGSQGDLPLHPELLDWLAAEFMDSGWDVKHMLRLMLTSQAYQRTSRMTDDQRERDPDNRLVASGPRFRPTGELLRDQALAASGLLSKKMYGAPVRPVTPSMGLTTAFGRTNDWTVSEGEDKHRRSLYTEVRRNSPYASFTTFDAGSREVCMIRRGRTNTPLQAFVTLNDPVFVEANQAMARRVLAEAAETRLRIGRMFKLCVAREPTSVEADALMNLHSESLAVYQKDAEAAKKLATDPLGPAPAGADLTELAALTAVANVVMNLDEFLMRR